MVIRPRRLCTIHGLICCVSYTINDYPILIVAICGVFQSSYSCQRGKMDVQNARNTLQLAIPQQLQMEVEFEDQKRKRRPKRFWVRPWLSARRKLELGHCHRLMRVLRMEDTTSFFNYLMMQPAMSDEILNRVGPRRSTPAPLQS